VEGPRGLDVEIEVDAAVVCEDEVAEGVDALDGVRVGRVGREEPGVFGGYEVKGAFVCPELLRAFVSLVMMSGARNARLVFWKGHGPCT